MIPTLITFVQSHYFFVSRGEQYCSGFRQLFTNPLGNCPLQLC